MRRTSAKLFAATLSLTLLSVAAGCARATRPDPTNDEWDKAVEGQAEAPGKIAVPEKAPRLAEPRDGVFLSAAELAPEQKLVVFTWSSSGDRSSYVFELAREVNFARVVYSRHTIHNTHAYRLREPGQYFWRVRTEGGLMSNIQRLSVLAVHATGRRR